MTLRLNEKWVWDFWFARDGGNYHIFYLQAPKSLGNPGLRHAHASIGHAVSTDLQNWDVLPDALTPSNLVSAWDDYATWTGSILSHNGCWFMFYTGINRAEKGLIQRIGLAISYDLIKWERYSQDPIIKIDPRWYEALDLEVWHEQAWRDPWVFEHNGSFHALITARINYGDKDSRGVIGYASSPDLLNWEVQAPLTKPGEFGDLEVPQLVKMGNRWYLFFSAERGKYSKSRLERNGVQAQTGTHYFVSNDPFGPFSFLTDNFLFGDEIDSIYSGKVILNPRGEWNFMVCNQFAPGKRFVGEISDPVPITILPDGRIISPKCCQKSTFTENSSYEG